MGAIPGGAVPLVQVLKLPLALGSSRNRGWRREEKMLLAKAPKEGCVKPTWLAPNQSGEITGFSTGQSRWRRLVFLGRQAECCRANTTFDTFITAVRMWF